MTAVLTAITVQAMASLQPATWRRQELGRERRASPPAITPLRISRFEISPACYSLLPWNSPSAPAILRRSASRMSMSASVVRWFMMHARNAKRPPTEALLM